jgi:ABC-type multidrug transport system permease subunit
MASHPPFPVRSSAADHPRITSHPSTAAGLKAFLIGVMFVLSILVFGLSLEYKSVLWLWIGFVCALVSGFFVQCLINRNKTVR